MCIRDSISHPLSATYRTNAWLDQNLYPSQAYHTKQEKRPLISEVERELGQIRHEITTITNKMKDDAEDYSVELEWKFAGRVLDRLCLLVSATFTVALSAAVLITAPKIIVI